MSIRPLWLAIPLALAAATGCTDKQSNDLKADADQAGDAAKNAAQTAGDATKKDVHDAAQDVADKTAQ